MVVGLIHSSVFRSLSTDLRLLLAGWVLLECGTIPRQAGTKESKEADRS